MVQVWQTQRALRDLRLGLFLCRIAAVSLTAAQSVADGAPAQKCVWRFLGDNACGKRKSSPYNFPYSHFRGVARGAVTY
jgi:hypothetical protein